MKDYLDAFKFFLKNSNEKELEFQVLTQLFQRSKPANLLDVGAGLGSLFRNEHMSLKRIVAVEKNGMFIEGISDQYDEVIHSTIEDLELNERFDVILMSHVFPYLEPVRFGELVTKLRSGLTKKGEILIFEMMGDGIVGDIKSLVLGKPFVSTYEKLVEVLGSMRLSHEERQFAVRVTCRSVEDAYRILAFFAEKYVDSFNGYRGRIIDLIEDRCRHGTAGYEINYKNVFVRIR